MQTLISILLIVLSLSSAPVSAEEDTQPQPYPTTEQPAQPYIYPDEPVFPMHELIKEPLKQNEKFFSEFLSMFATLGFIIALILIVAWFLKRLVNTKMEQTNSTSTIKVLERRNLSAKSMLYLLEIEGTGILIAESLNGITRLSEFPLEKIEEEQPKDQKEPFSKILEKK